MSASAPAPANAPSEAIATGTVPAAVKAPPAPIGILPCGSPVFASFQPSVPTVALLLTPYLPVTADPSNALPLPTGLALQRAPEGGKQLQLVATPSFATKLRRVFGYVGDLQLTDGEGTDTPAQLQIVIKIPWKYGHSSAEKENSWMYARVQAFVSKALFSQPAQVVKLGSCISGFLEPTSGTSKSCQLVGWDVCTLSCRIIFLSSSEKDFTTPWSCGSRWPARRFPTTGSLTWMPSLYFHSCPGRTLIIRVSHMCLFRKSGALFWADLLCVPRCALCWSDWRHLRAPTKPV